MALQCLTWIPYVWGRLVDSFIIHERVVSPLPDDVIIDILSRLPAECVLTCRMVCRQWRALTSISYFAELHLKRTTPLRFMHYDSDYNPVTQEEIALKVVCQVTLCGFFFHSCTKEYRLLYMHQQGDCVQFTIYSLGSNVCRQLSTFSYQPVAPPTPVIVNGALHWMVKHKYKNELDIPACSNSIMMFNMDTEDFCAMLHPGKECWSRRRHEYMHLLEMKGKLSFCLIYVNFIDIWVLEDYENWFWVRRYKVNLVWDVRRYPFEVNYVNNKVRLLNFRNDELLLDWYSRGIFRYHLLLHTVRKIERKGVTIPEDLYYYGRSTTYTKSLISLRWYRR